MKRTFTYRGHFLSTKLLIFILLLASIVLLSIDVSAQANAGCYQFIGGNSAVVTPVQAGALCPGCTFVANSRNVTDADRQNYASIGPLGIVNNNGLSVADTVNTYPAGYVVGIHGSFNTTPLSIGLLGNLVVSTYFNGDLKESKTTSSGLSVSLLSSATGGMYLSFPSTQSFDEVRLTFTGLTGAFTEFRVYGMLAFSPNCGIIDNNSVCEDQMAGTSTEAALNGGLTNALVTLNNAGNITDGNKNSYATLSLPAGVSLLSTPPSISVLEKELVHPGGNRVGFVVEHNAGLATADLLNNVKLQTYLHGVLKETATFGSGTLLQLSVLHNTPGKKEISFITTQDFNEVRMIVSQTATVNVGSIDIYYAFESPAACSNGEVPLASGQTAPNTGTIAATRTGTFGTLCAGQSLTDVNNVTSSSSTDFASFTPAILSVGCGAQISVQNNGTDYPVGTYAGFVIGKQGGLLDVGILNAITINVYQDGIQTGSSTGASLLSGGVAEDNSGQTRIGFEPTAPFDEIHIIFNSGAISASLGGTYEIYNAFVVLDSDNDGVPDVHEVCGTGNDAIDSDGDGTPDACDACSATNGKSAYWDTDGDGVADACDADTDDDGIADAVEDMNGDTTVLNDDADGDNILNYQDLDSDNDGSPDLHEAGIAPATVTGYDGNGNGVIDGGIVRGTNGQANSTEVNDAPGAGNNYTLADTDGDGTPDYIDLDADNDGINDIHENGNPSVVDANGDAMADAPDDDRDGVSNSVDGSPSFGTNGSTTPIDTDGDGIPDYRDLDSDNDAVGDLAESGETGYTDTNNDGLPDGTDTEGDGIVSGLDGNPGLFGDSQDDGPRDTDGDGIPDYRDPDSDNDGTNDIAEAGLGSNDPDGNGAVDNPSDPDGDGIVNNGGVDTNPGIYGGLGTSTLLNIRLLLEGAVGMGSSDTLMRDDLRQAELIPVNQPYNAAVNARFTQYNGGGEEMTTTGVLAANAGNVDAITDWVFIELRDAATPATIVRTLSVLVQRDGDVVSTDGNRLGVIMPAGNYYLSVKHRNHLGAMTGAPVVTSTGNITIDFKNGGAATFGTGAMKQVYPGYYALHGGDVNSTGDVYYTAPANDRDALLLMLLGNQFGYLNTYNNGDVNMDGESFYTAPDNDRDWLLLEPLLGNQLGYLQEQLPQ